MKVLYVGLVLALITMVLVGCGGEEAAPAPVDEGGAETYTSEVLDASYDGALGVSSQLTMGTLRLEETENGVTSEQAAVLLPLWQALQGGVTAQTEVAALLKQIEGTMTAGQLESIAAMQLTQDDMQTWMQSQGLGMGGGQGRAGGGQELSSEERATRQAEFGGGEGMPPEAATRRAAFENMTEEERTALRATREAGGGMPGGFGDRTAGGQGQFVILLSPLIEMLTQRAAE